MFEIVCTIVGLFVCSLHFGEEKQQGKRAPLVYHTRTGVECMI